MKKPVIFISHASDDKPKLEPYLRRLLERFGNRADLWIDSPQMVSIALLKDPRIRCISPGEDWFFAIKAGLDNASCLIAFWSHAAVARERDVLMREIDHARQLRKYVPVSIDAGVKVPLPFGFDQVFDASKFATGEDAGTFDAVLDAVDRVLMRRSRVVAANLLPYLVDRWDPVRAISGAVADDWHAVRADPSARVSPRAFVLPVHPDDDYEQLVVRIATKDGPEACGTPFQTDGHWFRVRLDISGVIGAAEIEARIVEELRASESFREARSGLAAVRKPILFKTTLQLRQISNMERFLPNWASFWCDKFKVLGLLGEHETRVPVASVLFVNTAAKQWWLPRPDQAKRRIEGFTYDISETPRARGLQRLAPVSRREAWAWSDRSDMIEYGIEPDVTAFLGRLFPNGDETMPMRNFCEAVKDEKWYQAISTAQLSGRAVALAEGRL